MTDEEQVNLLENPDDPKPAKKWYKFDWVLSRLDFMKYKRLLANLYYEWNKPMTYTIMVCINTYIILSCLFYSVVPAPVYGIEIIVMITFTLELIAKAILRGPKSLWEKDGKIDSIAYGMCFISMFGSWDFSVPDDDSDMDYSQMGDKYVKIFVVSFRIIAQLTRLFRAVICHYKAKFKCEDNLWLEMEENI